MKVARPAAGSAFDQRVAEPATALRQPLIPERLRILFPEIAVATFSRASKHIRPRFAQSPEPTITLYLSRKSPVPPEGLSVDQGKTLRHPGL